MSIRIREDNGNSGLFQSGNGAPSHLSPKGTLFLDKDAATVYINKDNLVNWTELGTGGSGSTLPTFTTGSVIFGGTSGLAQDNANFFWDDTNNRLGIGTNTPTNTLDVSGSSKITGEFRIAVRPGVGGQQLISFTHNDVYNAINSASWTYFQSAYGLFLGAGNGQNVYLGVNNLNQLSSVGIGYLSYQAMNASAILDIKSTSKGILIPRMSTTDRNAIITPATGLQVFDTTLGEPSYFETTWKTAKNSRLEGFTSSAGTVSSGDTIITAIQKIDGNVAQVQTQVGTVQVGNNLFNYYNFR
jgi:hypothetical protein